MPKLIFTSHYLRDAPSAQLENYVRYIGTREGVEKCDRTKELLPATEAQKKFIKQLIRDCIFRKNCASVPEERSAIPLQTEQSSAG